MPLSFSSSTGDLQQPINRHRRIQSVAPSPTVHSFDLSSPPAQRQALTGFIPQQPFQPQHGQQPSLGGFGGPADVPFGHGRRHSVNVGNKNSLSMSIGQRPDWAEDGYGVLGPQGAGGYPSMGDIGGGGGHSRQGSRMSMDGSWRISQSPLSVSSPLLTIRTDLFIHSISLDGGVGPVQQNGANMNSDLAQAQAQLQSIASFRAAAGGGHSKMASFALPNMLPNRASPFQPCRRHRWSRH